MRAIENQAILAAFNGFPEPKRDRLLALRELILDAADESADIGAVEETLKWGEPAYLAKKGSTLRLGWQKKHVNHCGLYFNCQTTLVDTIREVYGDQLTYEGNRAVLFSDYQDLPTEIVKQCAGLSLRYHAVKHLPLLGL